MARKRVDICDNIIIRYLLDFAFNLTILSSNIKFLSVAKLSF